MEVVPFGQKMVGCGRRSGSVISLPLWLPIALAIKLEDGGPVFYRFRVLGLGGRPFDAYKFRTMIEGADRHLREEPGLLVG